MTKTYVITSLLLALFVAAGLSGCGGKSPSSDGDGGTEGGPDADTDADSDSDADDPCEDVDCGENGECVDNDGEAECQCDEGYQDNDGDLVCDEDCETAALDCGDHGSCDDSSGTAVCDCDTGWTGDACDSCADGYQDNDENDTCEPSCESVDCSGAGSCDDSSGTAICTCDEGYTGDNCESCADGYGDYGDGCVPNCDSADCGEHGTCDDDPGPPECICDAGYQDNDDSLTCEPECATAGLDCGDHGDCDDSSGFVMCDCDPGYQDNGFDGICLADCDTAALACGTNAECDDSTGELECVCSAGYQDNDGNDTCEEDCVTAGLTCSDHGSCDDGSGVALCACDEGHEGVDCATCVAGYQDNDGNTSCLPDCATAAPACGSYGSCDDSGGEAICSCLTGYAGDACDTCDSGYQDNDDNGTCEVDCSESTLDCGDHGSCDDSSGSVLCACDVGYAGALCDTCDYGYYDTGSGCAPDCDGVTCSGFGTCDDSSPPTVCDCNPGYQDNDGNLTCEPDCATAAPVCDTYEECSDASGAATCVCSAGYQDNDTDGICEPNCATAGLDCGDYGSCSDATGTAVCACDVGYVGAACDSCDTAAGYQDNDEDGTCLLDCATIDLDCGDHGLCADAFGTAICVCDIGHAGANCEVCATDYQDNDGDGTCLPGCDLEDLECGTNATCDDSSGVPECACDPYYQDYDDDGVCWPKCAIAGLSCSANASCDDASGTPVCACDYGYQDEDDDGTCLANCLGVDCGGHGDCDDDLGVAACDCDAGYQDNDADLICQLDCATAGLTCSSHGSCVDTSGTAMCSCDTGYAGDSCEGCAAGYQDNDTNDTCEPDCATASLSCWADSTCSDTSGTATCLCDPGFQDNDTNGTCLPDCSTIDCGDHGSCSDTDGTADCGCETGYTGALCGSCDTAAGYQDNDFDGTCSLDCAHVAFSCGDHGACEDGSGTALCECDLGWAGATCGVCATGYFGASCDPDCVMGGVDCGVYGACDDSGSETVCNCTAGYQDNDENLTCTADCTTAGPSLACGPDTTCDDSSGTAQCVCTAGYQDNDDDGTCEVDCSALDCGANGYCADGSGTAICVCDTGYAGDSCEGCDIGYQDNDSDEICLPDCGTSGLACGSYGSCEDTLGEAECVCLTGYAGDLCDTCDAGYQDNDSTTTCEPDCATAALACGAHGACDDASGTALCACDLGWDGATCGVCASGYQDNDTNGTCEPDCATAGYTCSGFGSCDDSSGTATCNCNTGYQDFDANGTCQLTCNFAALECDEHELCDDASGTAQCVCDAGYQDHDADGNCLEDCSTSSLDCGDHGACEDLIGTVYCDCDPGYGGALCSWAFEQNLVAHFEFDGDLEDSTVNDYLAVGIGTINYVADPFGEASALDLDGASNLVLDAAMESDLDGFDQGSFAAWVRWDGITTSEVVLEFGSSTDSTGISRAGSSSAVTFWIGGNTITGGAVSSGQWFHLVATVGELGMRLFVNSQLVAEDASYTGPMFPADGTLYLLGKSTDGASPAYMNGALDDVRLYDRALTSFEAAALYAAGYGEQRSTADWDGDGWTNSADNDDEWPNPSQAVMGCSGGSCTWEIIGCERPWVHDSGSLFWSCPVLRTASEAFEYCRVEGAHLATIADDDENTFVWLGTVDDAWIGATDSVTEGSWEWITGEPWDWTGWGSDEPDGYYGDEDCAVLQSITGAWNDRYCELDYHFVCEYSY